MLRSSKSSLVINPDSFFNFKALPFCREHQLSEIRSCFLSNVSDVKLNAWISGPPGSGKSLCVRYLLENNVRSSSILPIFINCRKRFTFLSVVESILDTLKPLRSPNRMRGQQINILIKELSNRSCVIALDEIDILSDKDASELLHHLSSLSKVSVLCIAPSGQLFDRLPENVKSRLAPRKIIFPKYETTEIVKIVESTVSRCLRQNSWTDDVLHEIAKASNGDARKSIALLKHAVLRAVEDNCLILQSGHLETDQSHDSEDQVKEFLHVLSSHHKILYELAHSQSSIHSTKLEYKYRKICEFQGIAPVSSRTVNKYLNSLCQRKILKREHGAGTPGWIYRVPGSRMSTKTFTAS